MRLCVTDFGQYGSIYYYIKHEDYFVSNVVNCTHVVQILFINSNLILSAMQNTISKHGEIYLAAYYGISEWNQTIITRVIPHCIDICRLVTMLQSHLYCIVKLFSNLSILTNSMKA